MKVVLQHDEEFSWLEVDMGLLMFDLDNGEVLNTDILGFSTDGVYVIDNEGTLVYTNGKWVGDIADGEEI